MTHELGSKMASKHACIILHIRVSAYAVLLNIPRLWLCCWGGAGKGQRSSSPEGPEFVLSSLPWWPYPAFQVLWSTSSICAACSSPQVCAGLVGLEDVSGFSVLYWFFCFGFFFVLWGFLVLFSYERHSHSKKIGPLWVHSECIPRTSWTREVWERAKLWKKSHMNL